jgi:hypothetical protein
MASPFHVFRKYQKALMAVACLLAIVAFVFLPIFSDSIGGRGGNPANKVVVKTSKFGDLKESDIQDLMQEHRKVLAVLTDLRMMAGEYAAMAEQRTKMEFGPTSEEQMVNQWLIAKHAEQMGMVVSDDAINAFLKRWTRDIVKIAEIEAALKRSGLSELQFMKLLRKEVMTRQWRQMFYASMEGITPAERWDYFNRVKQVATIEAVPVDVASFTKTIEDPTDAELKTFFEENKDRFAYPSSPEPGFREPQRIALQWFKATEDQFTSKVTDAEIQERYEKNKKLYDDAEKKTEELKKEIQAKKNKQAAPKDAKPEAKKEDAVKKDVKANAKKDEKAGEKKPAEGVKAPTDPKAPEKKEEKKTSSAESTSPFRMVAYLADEKKPAADAKAPAAPATPAAPAKPAEAAKPAAPANTAPTTPAKPADAAKPAVAAQKPAETQPVPKTGMADATKKRIRREIADEKMYKTFEVLREKMDQYRAAWSKYEATMIQQKGRKSDDQKAMPAAPQRPDFEKLAKEFGLATGQSNLFPQWESSSVEIGDSLVSGRVPLASYAFQSMGKFRPEVSMNMKGDFYLFWKVSETKDQIPKFSDEGVREKVLRSWKMIRARKLALENAQATATKINESKKTLKEFYAGNPDVRVILPSPFSWMTFGNVPTGSAPNAARISDVTGVEFPGNELMSTVFHLEPGRTGAALNAPKTVAYVIRLQELTPSHTVIWKEFECDDFTTYASVAIEDQRQILRAWMEELKTSAGLKWERKPDQTVEGGNQPLEEE